MKRLHLGCGARRIPGFLNVDVMEYAHVDLVSRIDALPLDDSTAEVIYCAHCLEHFPRTQTMSVLREWHRVLAPGGTLRLSVPDFEVLARLYASIYRNPLSEELALLAEDRFGNRLSAALKIVVGAIIGGQTGIYDFHQALFDEVSLRAQLKAVGFKDVRRYDWRKTEHAEVDDYASAYFPHKDPSGVLLSLNIEATK